MSGGPFSIAYEDRLLAVVEARDAARGDGRYADVQALEMAAAVLTTLLDEDLCRHDRPDLRLEPGFRR